MYRDLFVAARRRARLRRRRAGSAAPTPARAGLPRPGPTPNAAARPRRSGRCSASTNCARRGRGLAPLAASTSLGHAAEHKSGDILRCDEFSHEACGRDFTYWMQPLRLPDGLLASGENIAWGSGSYATVRSIFKRLDALARATAKTSSAPTTTSASACGSATSKATAAPTSGPRSSAATLLS